jgi:hypothetical protein
MCVRGSEKRDMRVDERDKDEGRMAKAMDEAAKAGRGQPL